MVLTFFKLKLLSGTNQTFVVANPMLYCDSRFLMIEGRAGQYITVVTKTKIWQTTWA